jgi:hypothetical protein
MFLLRHKLLILRILRLRSHSPKFRRIKRPLCPKRCDEDWVPETVRDCSVGERPELMDSWDRHETLDETQLRVGERDVFVLGCAHGFLVVMEGGEDRRS